MSEGKPPSGRKPGGHIPALDGLRGVAILLVLFYHGTLRAGDVPLDRFVTFWTYGGWSGVDLFFVLSGFLITGILYDSKGARGYFKTFYARRFLRIFPPYYAVLTALFLILPRFQFIQENFDKLSGDEVWYWVYLSNLQFGLFHPDSPRRLDVFWSLAIEEQFYLIWPLVVMLFERRRLMAICTGMIGLAIAWRTSLVLMGAHPISVFVLTPGRVDGLAVGALVALAARGEEGLSGLLRWARLVAVGCALAVAGIAASYGTFDAMTAGMQILGYTLLALGFGAVLVLAVGSSPGTPVVRVLEHPALRAFGRYSYALYLFHLPLTLFIGSVFYRPSQFLSLMGSTLPGQLLFYVISISASLLLAWLSWHLFEKRILALKRYFPYGRQAEREPRRPRPETADEPAALGGQA